MSTIFISHSSQDNDIAREIERRLAREGHHSVFLDFDPEKGIVGGRSWERTLYRKLRACRAVIALCTNHYLGSHWCFAEIALARMEGKHILALQADPLDEHAKMPAILTEKQFIDLRRHADDAYKRLWRALRELDVLGVAGDWDPKRPPYLGLSAYQEEHAPVFFGREEESQAGIELLERGAPGLIMVLGASGSGKSSLVRAGMLPRLRSRGDDWLIVDPFRPGRGPLAEMTESLVQSFRRYAPDYPVTAESRQRIRERLQAGMPVPSPDSALDADHPNDREQPPDPAGDERLQRLIDLLERLREDPPPLLAGRLRDYLEWSLDDLRRIYDGQDAAASLPAGIPLNTTPLVDIAHELRRVSRRRGARVLIVIDQFEELLGREEKDEEAGRFLELLRVSIETDHSPLMVLATMRSDFLGLFQRNAALRGIDFESLSLGPMKIEGMRRVIEMPARLAAIELEGGLADRLLDDTETPDALPLLSFTLWVMWRNHRDDGKLELAEYERLGGLQGAITGEADAVLASARRRHREDDLRKALLEMARLSEDGSYARRPVSWDNPAISRVESILEKLVERRVLVSRMEGDGRMVEVAHEAIFRTWKPLRAWLDNARSELLLKQQLERDAAAWQESGRGADNLWRGGRLLQARELMGKQNLRGAAGRGSLTGEFVRAGLRRRLRLRVTMGAAIVAVIAVLAGFLAYALVQADLARQEKARALDLARVSVAGEWLDKDPMKAALVLLEVEDPANTRFAQRRMSEALNRGIVGTEYRHAGPVHSVAVSTDGSRVLTTSNNMALVWETHTGRVLRRLQHDETVTDGSFDPSGKYVVIRSGEVGKMYPSDRTGTTAWVWNLETGQLQLTVGHDDALNTAEFSPKGQLLATASEDNTVEIWDVEAADRRYTLEHDGPVSDASFSPDGQLLVTASGKTAQVWEVQTGEKVHTLSHDHRVSSASFNPDGNLVVTVESGQAEIWDTKTGMKRYTLSHQFVQSASFSPDGRHLLTASDDTVRIWNVSANKVREWHPRSPIQHARLIAASFSADGKLVITASGHPDRRGYGVERADNAVRFWDFSKGKQLFVKNLEHNYEVMSVAFGPRHEFVVANSAARVLGGRGETLLEDATARLWNLELHDRRLMHVLKHDHKVLSASFSPDGGRMLIAEGNTARLWEVETGREQYTLSHEQAVTAASFGSNGRLVVTASKDKTARLWDVETGAQRFLIRHNSDVQDTWLIAGGKLVVTVSDRTLRVWRSKTGSAKNGDERFALPLKDYGKVSSDSFSPDGKLMAAKSGKTTQVWDVEKGEKLFTLQHEGRVHTIAFAANGRILVTEVFGGDNMENIVQAWDMQNGEKKFTFGKAAYAHAFLVSPDGRTVLTAWQDGTVRLWDAETGSERFTLQHEKSVRQARFIAGGSLVVTSFCSELQKQSTCRTKVWDVDSGKERTTLGGVELQSATFSRNGKRMFADGKVWDVETGDELFAEPLRSQRDVRNFTFSPDGRYVAAKSGNSVYIWGVSGELLQSAIAAATTVCLSPEFRRQNLGESEVEARRKYEACEREHGRE
jgi:WD40 repeat protein